ncbi:hypothetical protein G3578_20560 [Brevibacillus sp. SYP-B805]|uniref:hypothetical protein n=1 Tax=Brevibacillus sp. SYP-B805 TaxID=1578199 RepID=UPI0013EC5980|nr:hypothetical protein [Brevibacillus sp. SYP-B805]NGQ97522.1 hypothetical protein [Brevibacillus sp. SYP-B805]
MRKKWWTVGVGFGIGAVMLFVSGFSAMANTAGYDTYKAALKNTKAVTSLTANADLTVTDNGTKVLAGTANIKLDKERNAGSMAATFGDGSQTHSLHVFRQDGKVIFKRGDDDVYRVMEQEAPKWQHEGVGPNPPKAVEQAFDALMGNMRELATVESESDGGKQAALHLSRSQIPAVVNALATLAVSKAADCDGWEHADMNVNLPKLTDNIQVENINLDANINPDNLLEEQTAVINITGTDDAGKNHVLAIRLHVDFSGFNKTIPDRIDLTGKQTLAIQHDGPKRGWHH